MNEMLSIENIWADVDFFEIKVSAYTKSISATTESYTTTAAITQLHSKLNIFLSNNAQNCVWTNGNKNNPAFPFISLEFFRSDKLGHVSVEVYIELNDATNGKHHCCFSIKTEIGLLKSFTDALVVLSTGKVGEKAVLYG